MEPVRVAYVGFGTAVEDFHLPLIGEASGTVLAGVVARSPRSHARAQKAVPGIPLSATLEGLLNEAPDIELVVIATPPDSHQDLAREALSFNRHVLVEKPFASITSAAEDLFETAASRSLLLTCFLNRRHDSDFNTVSAAVRESAFGSPVRLTSTWERMGPTPTPSDFGRSLPATSRGGMLGTGAHLVDQALCLLGEATGVTAHRFGIGWTEGDNLSSITLEHERGAVSEILITSSAQRFRRRLELLGTSGQIDSECTDPNDLTFATSTVTYSERGQQRFVQTRPATWARTYMMTASAIRTGSPLPVTPREVLTLQRVLDACLESAATGSRTAVAIA